ncbi:MAG: hypothetical protein JWO47_593 [Candidatus Saccharibacteria bacterium]|nr:hypothetical protein [Candidatus Saccharibacteria bacterium]
MSLHKNQRGSHVVAIVLVIVVLAAIVGVGSRVMSKSKHNVQPGGGRQEVASQSGGSLESWKNKCSGSGPVTMDNSPMKLSDVSYIVPTGLLAGAHVTPIDHLYFYPKDMTNRDAAPVYATHDGYIVDYENRGSQLQNGKAASGALRIVVQYTCSFYSYYDLLTSLDPTIAGALEKGDKHYAIKAGQEIGRVGAQSLDTAVYNLDLTLPGFVKPDSYTAEPWKVHTDDYFKYFKDPVLSQMLALNPRKVAPYGGKIDYDVAGKLSGNWFLEGTNGYAGPTGSDRTVVDGSSKGYYGGHFSIAPDAVDPAIINVSFGDYNGKATQFTAKSPLPNPANVGTADGIVKYDLVHYTQPSAQTKAGSLSYQTQPVEAVVLMQVLDGNKMKMEYFTGKTSADVSTFTSAAKTFTR